MKTLRSAIACLSTSLLLACGGGGGGGPAPAPDPPGPVAPAPTGPAILFMGNSHTAANGLPDMVAVMVRAARPGVAVEAVRDPQGMFLEERASYAPSLALLRSRSWVAVVLQAQKYSTSGTVTYPTTGAEALIREARAVHALPVMFPEWPRLGIPETRDIHDLHVSIAMHEPACVAPVGYAWDLAAARHPGLVLHASDGNHAAPAGTFLAALVIAATITMTSPAAWPHLPEITTVDAQKQMQLRAVAADTVAAHSPRQWCPQDTARP